MRISVIVNLSKKKAISCAREIAVLMLSHNTEVCMLSQCSKHFKGLQITYFDTINKLVSAGDIAVTVGGDGTIIHTAKYSAGAGKPLIGVNVGRLGFAADVESDEIGSLVQLLDGNYYTENRTLLDVEVVKNNKSEHYLSVNDAVIARGQLSRIIDIKLSLDGEEISKYRADGLLFSTPTGSTAYSLSAGGPILAPQMDCILMTPVCPHSLYSRSVLFSGNSVLSVKVDIPSECCCFMTIDGEKNVEILTDDEVIICKSELSLQLISLNKRNFYKRLNEKLKEREI